MSKYIYDENVPNDRPIGEGETPNTSKFSRDSVILFKSHYEKIMELLKSAKFDPLTIPEMQDLLNEYYNICPFELEYFFNNHLNEIEAEIKIVKQSKVEKINEN